MMRTSLPRRKTTGRLHRVHALALPLAAIVGVPQPARAQTSPSFNTTAFRFDALRRLTGKILPDPGNAGTIKYLAVRYTYDATGRLVVIENGRLSTWQAETIQPAAWTGFTLFNRVDVTYDAMDRKIKEATSDATGTIQKVTQYSYDGASRLECTAVRMNPAAFGTLPASACDQTTGLPGTFGADRITRNVYNAAGELAKVQKGLGTGLLHDYASYSYTADGKPASMTDADGNKATFAYDGFDRRIAWIFPSKTNAGSTSPCTVGAVAETVESFLTPTGSSSVPVTGPSDVRGSTDDCEKYAYDRNGNRVKLMRRDGDGAGKNRIIRYTYDALGRETVKDIPGDSTADVYSGYDLRGLQTYARFASASGSGIVNIYNGMGQLTSTTNNMGAVPTTLGYQYDADGNRKQLTYPDSTFVTYDYDRLDRLTTIKEAGATTIVSTTFDAQGRKETETRGAVTTTVGYDPVSRPNSIFDNLSGTTSDLTTTLGYSPADQITTKTRSNTAYAWTGYVGLNRTYAVNGLNQYTAAGSANFGYDDNGNLIGDGTNSYGYDVENRLTTATISGIGDVTLRYDPLGRLWQMIAPAKTFEFTSDGDSVVMELNGPAVYRYVHGPGEDDPLIQYNGAGYSTRYSLQADNQGSIVSVADATGALFRINAYDEYGITLGTNYGRFGYTGQMFLAELGLYYYKARMYSPTLGRFMQTDPIGYKDDANLYAYVHNDPVNGRDPSGATCKGGVCSLDLIFDDNLQGTRPLTAAEAAEYEPVRESLQMAYDAAAALPDNTEITITVPLSVTEKRTVTFPKSDYVDGLTNKQATLFPKISGLMNSPKGSINIFKDAIGNLKLRPPYAKAENQRRAVEFLHEAPHSSDREVKVFGPGGLSEGPGRGGHQIPYGEAARKICDASGKC